MLDRLRAQHQAIVDDGASPAAALALSSLALDSVTHALSVDSPFDAGIAGEADTIGFLVGGFGGPVTALEVAASASSIAYHTHVNISYG